MTYKPVWSGRYEFLFTPDFGTSRGKRVFFEPETHDEQPASDANSSREHRPAEARSASGRDDLK